MRNRKPFSVYVNYLLISLKFLPVGTKSQALPLTYLRTKIRPTRIKTRKSKSAEKTFNNFQENNVANTLKMGKCST